MELSATTQRFEFLFHQVADGFLEIDHKGQILTINPSITKLTGWQLDELKERTFQSLLGASSLAELERNHQGMIYRKDGTPCPIQYFSKPLRNSEGNIEGYFWVLQPIQDLKVNKEYDTLTGLPNKTLLLSLLNKIVASAKRNRSEAALLLIDLNYSLLDDPLAQQIAERLLDNVRKSDTLARTENNQFAIVIEESNALSVAIVAQKIMTRLEQSFWIDGREIYLSVSIGIANSHPTTNTDMLVNAAKTALQVAKMNGRSHYQFFTDNLNNQISERFILEHHLRQALKYKPNELSLYYQPKVNIQTHEIVGAEALLRWHNWEFGEIPTSKLVRIAEETGLIHPLGEWLIRTSCQQSMLWQKMRITPPEMNVSVNLSTQELHHPNWINTISNILDDTGHEPNRLGIELTEKSLMDKPEEKITALQAAKKLGLSIAIDDFGASFSSLNYLRNLPVNVLKIDSSFINDSLLTHTAIQLAHNLGLNVVAEGVETQDQVDLLKQHQCNFAQGYYFSKPLPFAQFTKLLSESY